MTHPASRRRPIVTLLIGLLLTLLSTAPAYAALKFFPSNGGEKHFLSAAEAFGLTTEPTVQGVVLHFRVTPGYYLYRGRFHFDSQAAELTVTPQFAHDGEWKDDPNLGHVEVYHQDIDITLVAQGSGTVRVVWQGCADAGLCYPPEDRMITLPAGGEATTTSSSMASSGETAPDTAATTAPSADVPAFLYKSSKAVALLILLGLGLGLSFTPCVLPMLPIVSGIIARQHTRSALRGFLLSLAYVLGMATTYALTGLLVGHFGADANLPAWFQHPVVLATFSAIFLALALSMFGLYELRLPSALHNHFEGLSRQAEGGRYIGSFIMGFFSALVVSPCVSAPLAGVIVYISTTGNALFGALALFTLAIGMGIPLLILGATEGRLLPKSGEWMNRIKTAFGLLMVGIAILLLGRILPGPLTLMLWAALAMVTAVWLGALEPVKPGSGPLWKGLGALLMVYALLLAIGAATGSDDALMPLNRLALPGKNTATATGPVFITAKTSADLDQDLQKANSAHQIVMLDFYADWCTSCIDMEKHVFTDPQVSAAMGKLMLLRADVTRDDADDRALMNRFTLYGPPAILFFRDGQLLPAATVKGEMNAPDFLARLNSLPGAQ